MRLLRGGPPILALGAGIVCVACGSSAGTQAGTPSASPSPAPTSTPSTSIATATGPATAEITMTGAPSIAGPLIIANITCDGVSEKGPTISLSGMPHGDPSLGIYVTLSAGSVVVHIGKGGGSTLEERDFAGTGVTDFDSARGAQLTGSVVEQKIQASPGVVGALTGMSGTVACGGQTAGTTTVTVTGTLKEGALGGSMSPVRVTCATTAGQEYVSIAGLIQLGSASREIIVTLGPKQVSGAIAGHFFSVANTGQATVTPTGGHVAADVTEKSSGSTLHISGDAVCGAG